MAQRSWRGLALLLAIVAVAGGVAVWWSQRETDATPTERTTGQVVTARVDQVDSANEGHVVRVEGTLVVAGAAVDPELGISSDAALMSREVEMYQWQERCVADACAHEAVWSASPIDSSRFLERTPAHANPAPFPLASSRFPAPSPKVGAYQVDSALLASLPSIPRRVSANELAPNLAASFREVDGVLYSGNDPLAPEVGDLRVRYHIVASGPVALTGVQRGDRLTPVDPGH